MTLTRLSLALALAVAARILAAETPSFEYDRSRPLGVAPAEVSLRNITYANASGERAEATLVLPSRPGRHAGVLFAHWYGEPVECSNRSQFLSEALRLARQGVVSLLVDTIWSDPRWFDTRNPSDDVAHSIEQVKDLRRALDVLSSLDEVDASRIAFVGHDFGAMYGAVVAAVDKRPKALAFVAGTATFGDWFLLGRKLDAAAQQKVRDELAPLDPVRHLAGVAPASVLFQFASKDRFVTREAADALVAAAGVPKTAKFYDCGHEMNQEATEDRVAWLLQVLGEGGGKR
jgi:cephalosporin-C deacetylase-like acetyl esterase